LLGGPGVSENRGRPAWQEGVLNVVLGEEKNRGWGRGTQRKGLVIARQKNRLGPLEGGNLQGDGVLPVWRKRDFTLGVWSGGPGHREGGEKLQRGSKSGLEGKATR